MLESTNNLLASNMETLNISIKNMMLSGEAPLVVGAISELIDSGEFQKVGIYRNTGKFAFSDYSTLNYVNKRLKIKRFKKTERLKKEPIKNSYFDKVIKTVSPLIVENKKDKTLEYYFPIRNSAQCQVCHGSDHLVRGIANFKVSIKNIDNHIKNQIKYLIIFFLISAIVSGVVLIFLLGRMILNPVLKIGEVVTDVGNGNFDVKAPAKRKDEIGDLEKKINNMIKRIKERFLLSKYISRSTEKSISGMAEEGVSKKRLTLLFSDIRGFTSFSESHPPAVVVKVLNKILSVQSEVVVKFNGDIDNFIGDAIMAVFEDEYSAIVSASKMIEAVRNIPSEDAMDLRVGVGIATGEAIAGDIGSENRKKYTVVGDTVNLASRLSALAPPNAVFISEITRHGVGDKIVAEEIVGQKIKGKSQAVTVYVVKKIKVKKDKEGNIIINENPEKV